MGVKKNVLYSSVLTMANYIFPLITFPYVSRVLGVSNLGAVNFVDSVISYFILFSMMGIATIGIREIAKNRDTPNDLSQVFSSLFFLTLASTIITLAVFILCMSTVPQFIKHKELMYIGGAKILASLFLIEWFYKGIEKFSYITIRSLIIKLIYVGAIFIFVKNESDYIAYYFITVGATILGAIINWRYSKAYIKLTLKELNLKLYLKPFVKNGLYYLLTSMYISFNVVYLGFVSDEKEVGFYTTAIKIYTILLALLAAFTSVLLPRISALIKNEKHQEVQSLINKSFDAVFLFCFPVVVFATVLASEIVNIIAGESYGGAVAPMQIIMPLLLVVGIAQILVFQILLPMKKDNIVLINSIIGGFVAIILNLGLVGELQSRGSAIVLVVSELVVFVIALLYVKNYVEIKLPVKFFLKNLFLSIPYILICFICHKYLSSSVIICVVALCISGIYFILSQVFLIKNQLLLEIISQFTQKKWIK